VKTEPELIAVLVEFFVAVLIIRRYYFTIAAQWYDPWSGRKREVETHFSIARGGQIRDNRRSLGIRGARYHQVMLFKTYGKIVPLSSLRVRFERQERAGKVDKKISVKARAMQYKGRQWSAKPLPSTEIGLRASKDENELSKFLKKMADDREAKRKRIKALKKRLWKELVENANKKFKSPK
jgi:hypothetical protein